MHIEILVANTGDKDITEFITRYALKTVVSNTIKSNVTFNYNPVVAVGIITIKPNKQTIEDMKSLIDEFFIEWVLDEFTVKSVTIVK